MNMANFYLALLTALGCLMQIVHSYNVLLLTPMGSRSHKIFYMGIVNGLLDRGHHVTIVSGDANSKPIENLKDVVIPNPFVSSSILSDVFEEGGADDHMMQLIFKSSEMCAEGLANEKVQDLKNDKYDVVMLSMFFDFCYLSLVDHMKVPLIYLSPSGLYSTFASITGQIDFPSISGNKLLEAQFPFTFVQRLKTITLNAAFDVLTYCIIFPRMLSLCKEKGLCRPEMPPFVEFNANVSLTIINSIRSLEHPPRPIMQNVIYAGGAHINPGKALPEDLEQWVQGSGETGFIYFSLGSAVNPSVMPERFQKIILKVFGSLKQRVLWKWNPGSMANLPPNVRLEKWLPQPDVLAHPKLRLFITHGGLLSTMEASYHGVPLLGMPIYADQFSNMIEANIDGYAKIINWKDLTEESFTKAINDVLNDDELKRMSKIRSTLIKDVPSNPSDDAAFWIEYVIRNKGAPHLRSPVFQLSWIELNNVDVYAVFLIAILIVLYVVYKILKLLLSCFWKKKIPNKQKKKKNKKD